MIGQLSTAQGTVCRVLFILDVENPLQKLKGGGLTPEPAGHLHIHTSCSVR